MSDNTRNSNDKENTTRKIVAITVVIVIVLLIAFYLIEGPSTGFSLQQFVGIIVAAALSGAITLLLFRGQNDILEEQRKGEAKKDKDVKIYSSKILAFSSFNRAVWQNDLDDTEPQHVVELLKTIRKELFSKALLYLDSSEIDAVVQIVKERGEGPKLPIILSSIVSVLNNNAGKTLSEASASVKKDDEAFKNSCQNLWDEFSNWIHSYDSELTEEVVEEQKGEVVAEAPVEQQKRSFNVQAWHFCMLGPEQMDKLQNGFNELSLVEYGQTWRTNLVTQVKPGDVVFLFRGNKKYVGMYRAVGWRALYYSKDDQGRELVKEVVSDGIEKKVVLDGESALMWDDAVNGRLKNYDFYYSFGDGSTSCANVVVEKLSYVPDGVNNPNTTYRRTISRYYWLYAANLLEEFMKADPAARERIEGLMPGFLKVNNL